LPSAFFSKPGDRRRREEIGLQHLIELWLLAANPLQNHRGAFDFFIGVMKQDGFQICVVGPLTMPIHRFQFLHASGNCVM
jgi:hypothetical protein